MKKAFLKYNLIIIISLVMIVKICLPAFGESSSELNNEINNTATYLYNKVESPQIGSIGGEWTILGLARCEYKVPKSYFQNYYNAVEEHVKENNGVLSHNKYTEYSRVILALTAIGKDPRNVAGYNLLMPLGDFEKTIWQGINGPIFALLALDSGNYEIPLNKTGAIQATRERYIDEILSRKLLDGGFSLRGAVVSNAISDIDVTAMVLQALAKYEDRIDVKVAIEDALDCLSKRQDSTGGYRNNGVLNAESTIQVIVALCELGIPITDSRFIKNGNSLLDNLMTYYSPNNGFVHTTKGSSSNLMTTEQGLYALAALKRVQEGKNSLYRMSDALPLDSTGKKVIFKDIKGHKNQAEIEALVAREIINGKTNENFDPDATITRGEFATIVVRALGLIPKVNKQFQDVKNTDWFAPYVGTAYTYGIVTGKSDTIFNPNGTITRQEAATMVLRAAKLCGINTIYDSSSIRDMLSIKPKENILRCEVAQILYNLLDFANLL